MSYVWRAGTLTCSSTLEKWILIVFVIAFSISRTSEAKWKVTSRIDDDRTSFVHVKGHVDEKNRLELVIITDDWNQKCFFAFSYPMRLIDDIHQIGISFSYFLDVIYKIIKVFLSKRVTWSSWLMLEFGIVSVGVVWNSVRSVDGMSRTEFLIERFVFAWWIKRIVIWMMCLTEHLTVSTQNFFLKKNLCEIWRIGFDRHFCSAEMHFFEWRKRLRCLSDREVSCKMCAHVFSKEKSWSDVTTQVWTLSRLFWTLCHPIWPLRPSPPLPKFGYLLSPSPLPRSWRWTISSAFFSFFFFGSPFLVANAIVEGEWRDRRVVSPKSGVFSHSLAGNVFLSSLSGGLLVELWPRFKPVAHPMCATFLEPRPQFLKKTSNRERRTKFETGEEKRREIFGGPGAGWFRVREQKTKKGKQRKKTQKEKEEKSSTSNVEGRRGGVINFIYFAFAKTSQITLSWDIRHTDSPHNEFKIQSNDN